MSTLVIKNLPEKLHDKLREQAARHHRSMTKEAVTLIEAGVTPRHVHRQDPLAVAEPAPWDPVDYIGKWPRYKSIDEVVEYVRELRKDRDED